MQAKLNVSGMEVVDVDNEENVVTYNELAAYVIAADFGMKNADEASEDEVEEFLESHDGDIIEVDPDYFC